MFNRFFVFLREYKAYIYLSIFLTLSLLLLTFNTTENLHFPRKISLFFFSSFQNLIVPLTDISSSKLYLNDLREQNEILMGDLNEMRNSKEELEELRTMLGFKKRNPVKVVSSKILYKYQNSSYNYLIADVGEEDGVYPDMPVITARGIVGVVYQTSKNLSVIKSVKNLDFRLSLSNKKNIYGIFRWDGENFKLLNIPKSALISRGDVFYVSEFSNIFPRGIPVGYVSSIKQGNELAFFDININLSQNIDKVMNVFILPQLTDIKKLELLFNLE